MLDSDLFEDTDKLHEEIWNNEDDNLWSGIHGDIFVVVREEVFGDSNESSHLPEIQGGVDKNCREAEVSDAIYEEVIITADSGFHSEKNMKKVYSDVSKNQLHPE